MFRKFLSTVAVGSLLVGGFAASNVAMAQPGPQDGRGGGRGGIMMMADANKDGTITKAELTAALNARFAKMDVNGDGQITQADRDARRAQRMEARFTALDADRNGQISKAEFTAGHQARMDKRAEAGKGEGRKGHHFRGGHRGGKGMMGGWGGKGGKDGVVTKAQFMAGPIAMFDRADTNKDGKVTAQEMTAAREAMREAWKARKAAATPAS
ncbi:MAG: calcium-binding protein [Sphingobium sp.]